MIEVLGVQLYNQREAADLLGVTTRTIRAMCRRGQLARTRVGAATYITEESLKSYVSGKTFQRAGKYVWTKKEHISDFLSDKDQSTENSTDHADEER